MKELEGNLPDKSEYREERLVKKSLSKIGELRPFPGQKIFELNLSTGIINEATFKEEKVVIVPSFDLNTGRKNGHVSKSVKDIDTKENCLYVNAINPENADRKFHRMLGKPYKKQIK